VAEDTSTLEFDSLKVSNLEFTAEEAFARGGRGNPKLITWDYNREATLTLQDALLSMKTLAAVFGDGDSNAADGVVEISADTYPGYYKVEGETWAKDRQGTTHLFKFEIPKAKISSNATLTMEAEGDPTVFDITLTALQHTTTETDSGGKETTKKHPLVKLTLAEKA
jgi:hypothetical protein